MEQQNQTVSQQHKKSTKESPLVRVIKTFNAPVGKVFRAWIDAETIKQWWGPEMYSCPFAETDFREGGKYLFSMKGPDGKEIFSGGEYLKISANELIVCTDYFADKHGNQIPKEQIEKGLPYPVGGTAYITVEFESINDNRTMMTISHERLPASVHDECVDGWSSSLEKLRKVVETH